jgi:hypothetical protein
MKGILPNVVYALMDKPILFYNLVDMQDFVVDA